MLYRRELCDLTNPEEADLLVTVVGKSLRDGPPEADIVTISDETPEGRDRILNRIKRGAVVLSITDE